MVAKDTQLLKKPNTQDLADFLIDQLPDNTDDQIRTKEAILKLCEKLKEVFDYYENTIEDLQ